MGRAYRPRTPLGKVPPTQPGAGHSQNIVRARSILLIQNVDREASMQLDDRTVVRSDAESPLRDRLQRVCLGVGVQWSAVAPVLEEFTDWLASNTAVSIDPMKGALGITTGGDGQSLVYRTAKFMDRVGLPSPAERRFLARAKQFHDAALRVKVEANLHGVREVSTYVCAPASIRIAHACLADSGVDAGGIGIMEAVAEVLGGLDADAIGTAASASGDVEEKVYFSVPASRHGWTDVRSAAHLAGVSDVDWAAMSALRPALNDRPLRVSVNYRNGAFVPGIQVGIGGISPDLVDALLRTDGERQRANMARNEWARKDFSSVSFRLTPGSPLTLKTSIAT